MIDLVKSLKNFEYIKMAVSYVLCYIFVDMCDLKGKRRTL